MVVSARLLMLLKAKDLYTEHGHVDTSRAGVLATLKITGARCSNECKLFVDPKSKILQKSDQNEES